MQTTDIRTIGTTLRAQTVNNEMKIAGTAVVFNQPSEPMGFIEYIQPDAFDNVDLSKVLLLYNHEYSNVLARVDAGNLKLVKDDNGLQFSATLPDTTLARDVFNDILAGNVQGCSFGFCIADDGDTWNEAPDGSLIHTITQLENVSEISLTPIPAYTETSVNVQRSLTEFKKKGVKAMTKDEDKEIKPTEKKNEEKRSSLSDKDESLFNAFKAFLADEERNKKVKKEDDESDKNDESKDSKKDDEKSKNTAIDKKDKEESKDDDKSKEKDDSSQTEKNKKEGKRSMATLLKSADKDKKPEEVRNFEHWLRNEKRDLTTGFKEENGAAVIPQQILSMQKVPNDPNLLAKYVNRVTVTAPTGRIPVLAKATATLVSAAELQANPNIANAQISSVLYTLATKRGALPISLEMIQDYPDITPLLTNYVQTVRDNTEQQAIGAVLQKATAKTASSLDEIKSLFNSLVNYGADRMFVVTASMYTVLDTLKDNEGRYLLNENIATGTGKMLLGAPVLVVPDAILGTAGETKMFVGSVKAFATECFKGEMTLKWQENDYFEQVLAVAIRMDVEPVDTNAGYFVTYGAKSATTAAK